MGEFPKGAYGHLHGTPRGRRRRNAGVFPLFSYRSALAALLLLLLCASPAAGAVYGDRIVNSARLSTGEYAPALASVAVRVEYRTMSSIEALEYAGSAAGARIVTLPATSRATGPDPSFPFAPLPPPSVPGYGPLAVGVDQPLRPAGAFPRGYPVFVQVSDPDRNRDPDLPETVLMAVYVDRTGDRELLRLSETGEDTGLFIGYVPTASGVAVPFDGVVTALPGDRAEFVYTDARDAADTFSLVVLVDPYGVVFDSRTGEPVNGAVVTLLEALSGAPATVFAEDGVTPYPSTVTTGGSVTDGAGRTSALSPGRFHFPFVAAGTYRLSVRPPAGWTAPSAVSPAELQSLPGAPFAILTPGSFGGNFAVPDGPPVRIDIPVDSRQRRLWVRKSAGASRAAVGDFVSWEITAENAEAQESIAGTTLFDRLPLGFRYRKGSARLDGAPLPDPAVGADGRTLAFPLGELPPGGARAVRYVTEVGAGARPGGATNEAWAVGEAAGSNRARATVEVGEDLLRSRAIVMGRVVLAPCGEPDGDAPGVPGVRLLLEDGTTTVTDPQGRYHLEGVRPGTHVLQLDLESLPPGTEPLLCDPDTRHAGRPFSQFVDVQGGTLWRADFRLAPAPKGSSPAPAPPEAAREGTEGAEAPPPAKAPDGILSPADGARLFDAVNAVRVRLDGRLKPRLLLDGREIPAERIGLRLPEEDGRILYSYIGVDFGGPGERRLRLQGIDPFGNARFDRTVVVVRTGEIASIRVLEAKGNVADGRTPVRVRLELRDRKGEPIRAPARLELRGGNLLPPEKPSALPDPPGRLPRPGGEAAAPTVEVAADGTVLFRPTGESGAHRAVLGYNDVTAEVETYLRPHLRDWVLVGLAEGTAGWNVVSGNMENFRDSDTPEDLYKDGRLAFYAKGQVRGDWLVTLAYDSDKPSLRDERRLFGAVDPQAYYTLYGDASRQDNPAASSEKLYLRIEREGFYALFGDFAAGLDVTELSRYSRNLTGVKAELRSEDGAVTAFASQTPQSFARDEIRGDGTSGLYRLSRRNLVMNSETIALETRDRFRPDVVLESRPLTRHLDYDIDYREGTLFFKEPVWARNENFDPVFIVADYEIVGSAGNNLNYGGRGSYRLFDRTVEVGATLVHEEDGSGSADLYGVDLKWAISPTLALRAEGAASSGVLGERSRDGSAWLAEVSHRSERLSARGYFREQERGFGLGQLSESASGVRRFGGDAAWRLGARFSLSGQAYREEFAESGASRDLAEAQGRWQSGGLGLHLGGRTVADRSGEGGTKRSEQLLAGGSWRSEHFKRLTLRLNHEQSLGSAESADFPTRTLLGADYLLTRSVTLFAEQELTFGETATRGTRAGLRASPWRGAQVKTSLERQFTENAARILANFGLKQSWQITERWGVDAGLDRSQTLEGERATGVNPNAPAARGGEDYTAVSLGLSYRMKEWMWWSRLEQRTAAAQTKYGLAVGLVGEPRPGLGLSAQTQLFRTDDEAGGEETSGDVRLGAVWRPNGGRWTFLERLDFILNDRQGTDSQRDWRIVNNLNANVRLDRRTQLALQYGVKYVRQTIGGESFGGFTDLVGMEGRYDLTPRWDVGVRGSLLHSWSAGLMDYSAGASVGWNALENVWVSLGYNVAGFSDADFPAAGYTAQGPFVQVRAKFDQQSVRSLIGLRTPPPLPAPAPLPPTPPAPRYSLLYAVLSAELEEAPVLVAGSVVMPSLLLNGEEVALPAVDIVLEQAQNDVVALKGSAGVPLSFAVAPSDPASVAGWECTVHDAGGNVVRTLAGQGAPPPRIPWDGRLEGGRLPAGGEIYQYQIELRLRDGGRCASPRRLFGVSRVNPVSLSLTGSAFAFNSAELTAEAKKALRKAAELLRRFPEERIVIEGHADNHGTREGNLTISRRRAEAAAAFLTLEEKIAPERLLVRAFGDRQPVASNAIPEGRELNRRVEIRGSAEEVREAAVRDQFRAPAFVQVEGRPLAVDELGRFAASVPAGGEILLDLTDPRGGVRAMRVALPRVTVESPAGRRVLPAEDGDGHRYLYADPSKAPADAAVLVYTVAGRTAAGNTVEIDRDPVPTAPDGTFRKEVHLRRGENLLAFLVRTPAGVTRVAHLKIRLEIGGEPPRAAGYEK